MRTSQSREVQEQYRIFPEVLLSTISLSKVDYYSRLFRGATSTSQQQVQSNGSLLLNTQADTVFVGRHELLSRFRRLQQEA